MNQKSNFTRKTLPAIAMAGPVSLWMILFVALPMLYIIYISFMSRGVFGEVVYEFSLDSYKTLLDSTYFKVIIKSIRAAAISTILCLLIGYPFAYYIAKQPKEIASKLIMLIMIPFWTNSLMRLNSWLLLFQTSGPVNKFLQYIGFIESPLNLIYTDGLVMVGLITSMLPFAVLPMYSSIEKLSKSLLEASADLGASRITTFIKITLPLTFPGIINHSCIYSITWYIHSYRYVGWRQSFIHRKYNKKSIRSNKKLASWCCFICIINCYNRASYIYIYKICKD